MGSGRTLEQGPDGGSFVLPRPRVGELLDGVVRHRVTAVVAGVGSGKTTALRTWSPTHSTAWHAATSADTSLGHAARSIIEVLRLRLPRLSTDLTALSAEAPDDDKAHAERIAARLGQESATMLTDRPLVLVIDDLHEIDPQSAGMAFVAGLCRNAPHDLHVVLVSRDRIPFSLARFALESGLLEIRASDLAFTGEETLGLLTAVAGVADPDVAAAVDELGRGWAAVTRLAAEALRTAPATTVEVLEPRASDGRLFDFLANEVLGAEPAEVRLLLRFAAEMPWITPRTVAALGLGIGDDAFERASRRGVYFTRIGHAPEAVALVPVIRDYLATLPLDVDRSALARAAGDWYASIGAYSEAVACYRRSEDTQRLAGLLSAQSAGVLADCPVQEVIEACRSLPGDLQTDPIRMLAGEAHQMAGDWASALAQYRTLEPPSGPIPAALAWRIGLLSYLRGDRRAAIAAYERALTDGSHPGDEAMVLAWHAAAEWVGGNVADALRLANQGLELAQPIGDSRALAAAHTVLAMVAASEGDRLGNDAHYLRALEHAERARDTMQLIRIRVNRGSRSLEEGAYHLALEELDEALRLADVSGYAAFRALALSNRGQVLFHLGRLDEAIVDLEASRAVYRSINSTNECYPLAHLGDVYRMRGDVALARASYEQALDLAERQGDVQGLIPSLAGLALLLAADDPDAAELAAERAAAHEASIDHAHAQVVLGWVTHASGKPAGDIARNAAQTATRRRDLPALADALELEAVAEPATAEERLGRALEIWQQLGNPVRATMTELMLARNGWVDQPAQAVASAVHRLRTLGALGPARDAERRLASAMRVGPPLPVIQTFGGFAVLHDGVVVPTASWQSKKARDVLKMLVACRGRAMHREVLIDRLWPEDDPRAAANRLSVALSTVRSVLDPSRSMDADHFLRADRESVALVVDHLAIDVETFMDQARRGLAGWSAGDGRIAVARLESAEAAYVGDFMEDDPYEEWVIPLREECRNLYLRVASTLADRAAESGDWEACARYYLRMLERDPYHEPSHLGLVEAQSRLGRHGTARRLYGHYVARMQELDIDPAPFPQVR